MEYKEVLNYLYNLERFGTKLGLSRTLKLLAKLKNPHKNLRVIHVAGTNGKGSVCAMLSSILKEAGYKVGMYTSPHLKRFTERFLINNKEISKKELVSLFNKTIKHRTNQTFFETITAMAFLYFKKKVDFLVLEVGLGGRLDATNVIKPLVSVITNIELEHTDYLGKNIKQIAYEKAGIIKKNCPVVTGCKNKSLDIIKKICKERNSKLFLAKSHKKLNSHFSIGAHKNLRLNLKGNFQLKNASVAITTIDVLKKVYKIKINEKDIINGLKNVKWDGRLQFVKSNILVDCAHNPAGIKALKKEILKIRSNYKKIVLVIGILKDKDYAKMLKLITPLADKTILTKVKIDRAADPEILKKYVKSNYTIIENVSKSIEYAKSIANKRDLILVTGSIYLVSEIFSSKRKN